ncbi:hypothetical protein DL546_003694 [Coniochaeta pulveracea]|uniref:BCS1 N-terminal domain-containing protein n=1 Tax=Coniochaeta pulveracea TaxID=177199 RepID=A0A420Y2M9_9PEZI|nr:hypothetical protein DL546_003694 [Coniochaeta pulveracea]
MAANTAPIPPPTLSQLLNPSQLFENPLFAGGIGLASLGAAAAFARRGVISGFSALRRRMLVNVEISRRDPSYPWVLAWLSQPRDQSGFIARRITRIHNLSVSTATRSEAGTIGGPVQASFFLQPGYGRHIIRVKEGVYISVNREKTSTANMSTGEPHETVTLTALWPHRHVFEEVFMQAHALSAAAHEGKTVVYSARKLEWAPLGEPRKKRPLGSVILDEGVKEGIVEDVKDFLSRQACVAMINLSEVGVTDDHLAYLLTKLPKRSILLLEDCDAAFQNRRQRESDGYSGPTVTFSGLLNALDGLAAGEERIAFLTTNHIDRLDAALIRPGRVDMMVRIGEATRYQAAKMWDRFYGDIDVDGKKRGEFLNRLEELGLFGEGDENTPGRHTSTAAIQGLFLFNKDDMQGAIDMAEGLIPRTFEPEPQDPNGAIKSPA